MRTIKLQATPAAERVMTEWLAHLVLAIPAGPDGGAIIFDGDLGNGIVVAQRHEGRWSVSFRPNPDGSRIRHYTSPQVVARVILSNPRQHDEAAALDPLQDERDVTADPLACTGMEPAPGSPALLHLADRERPAGYGWRGALRSLSGTTNAPLPGLTVTYPASTRIWTARPAVPRLIPYSCTMVGSLGTRPVSSPRSI